MFKSSWIKRKCKVLFVNESTRRQKNPSTLQECMEGPSRPFSFKKPFLVICLLMPTFYYMFYYTTGSETSKENLGPFSEMLQDNEDIIVGKDVVTESDNIVMEKGKSDNPERFFKLETQIETKQKPRADVGKHLPRCVDTVIGNVTVFKIVNSSLDEAFPMIERGGYYRPLDCRAKHKVAILVPFRNRDENLRIFLYNIHPFLMRQKLEYRIFVIEQTIGDIFNKGRLFNAGFLEIQLADVWECIVFHDVDLLPTNDWIRYSCPLLPRHMCAAVVEKENDPKFSSVFGGVTAMTMWQYKKVNGYSNLYWGWGGEDNDMYKRLQEAGLGVTRYKKNVARYVSLNHSRGPINIRRYNILKWTTMRYKTDGLSSLRYRLVSYVAHRLFTHYVVNINPPALQDTYITEDSVSFL